MKGGGDGEGGGSEGRRGGQGHQANPLHSLGTPHPCPSTHLSVKTPPVNSKAAAFPYDPLIASMTVGAFSSAAAGGLGSTSAGASGVSSPFSSAAPLASSTGPSSGAATAAGGSETGLVACSSLQVETHAAHSSGDSALRMI